LSIPKILLADDDDAVREMTQERLESKGFEVVAVGSVNEALEQIVAQKFDVLVTDLQMPLPGDGFTVVSAMRHSQPSALTIVVSGFPDTKGAVAAILLEADEILAKPFDFKDLTDLIQKKRQAQRPSNQNKQSVATILERDAAATIQHWVTRVAKVEELKAIALPDQERTSHLPEILRNIIARLRGTRELQTAAKPSAAAVAHGLIRFRQGYTAPLIVEESRILQVCIFETIQRSLVNVDFSLVLPDVMLIADEVDAQLKQCIDSFLGARSLAPA
jgi:DNA-binding response OmpR family regulator